MSVLKQIGASISLILIIIGIISFFLPSPYYLISVVCFVTVFFIWFIGFTWRIATAADNAIQRLQDDSKEQSNDRV